MHGLRVDAIIQDGIIRSSGPFRAVEAQEPTCGVCRSPLASATTQAWPSGCGHVLHLECHLDLYRHAPPGERIYCPTCRMDEAGDPRPTRCVHGSRDRCSATRDGSRPCGQRCRHNGWSHAAPPSSDSPCPACHPGRSAPGAALLPPQPAAQRAPEAAPAETHLCGTCGEADDPAGLHTCTICGDYIEPPEAGALDGEPWPTDECEHWVHCDCLRGTWAPEAEPDCPGCLREGITNRWLNAPATIHAPQDELPLLPAQYAAQLRPAPGTRPAEAPPVEADLSAPEHPAAPARPTSTGTGGALPPLPPPEEESDSSPSALSWHSPPPRTGLEQRPHTLTCSCGECLPDRSTGPPPQPSRPGPPQWPYREVNQPEPRAEARPRGPDSSLEPRDPTAPPGTPETGAHGAQAEASDQEAQPQRSPPPSAALGSYAPGANAEVGPPSPVAPPRSEVLTGCCGCLQNSLCPFQRWPTLSCGHWIHHICIPEDRACTGCRREGNLNYLPEPPGPPTSGDGPNASTATAAVGGPQRPTSGLPTPAASAARHPMTHHP